MAERKRKQAISIRSHIFFQIKENQTHMFVPRETIKLIRHFRSHSSFFFAPYLHEKKKRGSLRYAALSIKRDVATDTTIEVQYQIWSDKWCEWMLAPCQPLSYTHASPAAGVLERVYCNVSFQPPNMRLTQCLFC